MKFEFTFGKTQIDDNGKVNAGVAKKAVEDCAEKAFDLGKTHGWVLGGLFVAGVYIAVDAVCNFLGGMDDNDRK